MKSNLEDMNMISNSFYPKMTVMTIQEVKPSWS